LVVLKRRLKKIFNLIGVGRKGGEAISQIMIGNFIKRSGKNPCIVAVLHKINLLP